MLPADGGNALSVTDDSQGATASTQMKAGEAKATGDDASSYSTRTSFNTATGEWTLVVERHPPEVGVTVAEQKGFISQYSAKLNSSTSVRNAVSLRI